MAKWSILMFCAIAWTNLIVSSAGAKCSDIIDIGLVIDTSASMDEEWIVSAMAFAIQLTENFTISQNDTRFSLITFSKEAKAEFLFKDYTTEGEIQLAVEKIDMGNSSTRIDRALQLALDEVFTKEAGSRPTASRFLIVATDGHFPQTGIPTFISLLLPLTDIKVEILSVGIGHSVDLSELNALAFNKAENVFSSPSDVNRNNVIKRIHSVTNIGCSSPSI